MFILVCLLALTAAQSTSEALLFFEGFAIGLEAEIGNPDVCAKDANITLADFDAGYNAIKRGIAHLSIKEVEQGLQDWAAGLNMMAQTLRDCGANTLAEDVEKLAAEIMSGASGLLRLLAEEIINIIDHDVYTLFRQAISSFQHQQYKQSGEFTGQIVGILLQPGNDFHNSALLKNGLLGLSLN